MFEFATTPIAHTNNTQMKRWISTRRMSSQKKKHEDDGCTMHSLWMARARNMTVYLESPGKERKISALLVRVWMFAVSLYSAWVVQYFFLVVGARSTLLSILATAAPVVNKQRQRFFAHQLRYSVCSIDAYLHGENHELNDTAIFFLFSRPPPSIYSLHFARLEIEQLAIFIYLAVVSCLVSNFSGKVHIFSKMKTSRKKGQTHCQLSTFVMFYLRISFLLQHFRLILYLTTVCLLVHCARSKRRHLPRQSQLWTIWVAFLF